MTYNEELSDSERKQVMECLRVLYSLAVQRDAHRVSRPLEIALMIVTEPLDSCTRLIPDWDHPCLCRECRSCDAG